LSLFFLGFSLILQFFVGVISLLIANRRAFLEKYGEDSRQSLCENICHCKLVREPRKKKKKLKGPKSSNANNSAGSSAGSVADPNTVHVEIKDDDSDEESCCPWKCTTKIYKDYETNVIEMFEAEAPKLIETELRMVSVSHEDTLLKSRLEALKKRRVDLEATSKDEPGQEERQKELKDLKAAIADIELQLLRHEELLNRGSIEHSHSKLLFAYVEAITKNRVLKNTTFWQSCVNYMLYLIFVLNALITGFGIASPSGSPSETAIFRT
jgi:hypothetical protein